VGVTAAPHQHLTRPALDIEDGHLCGIEAAGQCRDREEHGLPAGQPFRPYVIGFSLCGVGARKGCCRSTRRRNLLMVAKRQLLNLPPDFTTNVAALADASRPRTRRSQKVERGGGLHAGGQ
jgi:hypothetical protein